MYLERQKKLFATAALFCSTVGYGCGLHTPRPGEEMSNSLPAIAVPADNVPYAMDGLHPFFGSIQIPNTTEISGTLKTGSSHVRDMHVGVFLVNFPDDRVQPFGIDDVRQIFLGEGLDAFRNPSVGEYYRIATFGSINLRFTFFDWYAETAHIPAGCETQVVSLAGSESARRNNIDINDFPMRVYIYPNRKDCPGELGRGGRIWGGSEVFINGRLNGHLSSRTIIHEIGHGLGLGHAASIGCPDPTNFTNNCIYRDKGGSFDPMGGNNPIGHFNGVHLLELGVINLLQVQELKESGEYTLVPIENYSPNIQLLKIKKQDTTTNGLQDYYYLEYRRNIDLDSNERHGRPEGVLINIWNGYIWEDNPTKEIERFSRESFYINERSSFYDVINGIRISQIARDEEKVRLSVTFDDSRIITPQEFRPMEDYR